MAEYCVKKMLESNSTIEHAVSICPGKTYNNLVDQLEGGGQAGEERQEPRITASS